jgi:Family of unknown function (DUF6941)
LAEVDCLLLADAAQVANGKLFVLGGGWSRLAAPTVPLTRPFDLAVRVVIPWTETNQKHMFELYLLDEDGRDVLEKPVKADVSVGRPVALKEGSDQSVPFVIRLPNVKLEHYGRFVFELRHHGEPLARTAFDLTPRGSTSQAVG